MSSITYRDDVRPDVALIADLYRAAPLNRPVDDLPRMQRFFDGSNIVLTAWDGDRLAGILRAWTDGGRDGYVCDLAIHPEYQKQGIGQELLRRCIESDRQIQFVLRASKIAEEYYPHIGWEKIDNGWFVPREG